MHKFKAWLAAGVSLSFVPIAGEAQTAGASTGGSETVAPQPPTTATDEIVVTGFRRSLDRAVQIKRNSDVVSDVISAADIGKFPDQNLAESLQRVTGVQITRNRGEGGSISIRGLSPSFVRTQYNGRTFVTGGDRSFDFTTLSALFVSAVEVQKSPTADLIEGGLSGTVNISTARPLDVGRTTIVGTFEGIYEDLYSKTTPRVAALANYVNPDKTFGVSFGAAYEKRRPLLVLQTGFGAETAKESSKNPPIDYNVNGNFNDTYTFDHAQEYDAQPGTRDRLSFIGGAQLKLSPTVELYVDGLFTKFRDNYTRYDTATRYTNIAPARPGDPYGVVRSTIDTSFNNKLLGGSQGFLTSINANGVDYRTATAISRFTNENFTLAGGSKFDFGKLKLGVEGNVSQGVGQNVYNEPAILSRSSALITRPNGLGGLPLVTFERGYNPLDPTGFNYLFQYLSHTRTLDREADGRADLTYDVGEGSIRRVVGGLYYSDRHFLRQVYTGGVNAQQLSTLSGGKLAFQPNVEGGSVNAAPFLSPSPHFGGDIPGFPSGFLVLDLNKLYSFTGGEAAFTAAGLPQLQLGSGYDVTERTKAGYLRVDFSDSVGRLSGNIGARYVDVNLLSQGFGSDLNNLMIAPGGVQTVVPPGGPLSVRNHYSYVLPSLNAAYNVTDALKVRFAAARVLARPDFSQLAVGLSVNANVLNINSANPNLKPYLSDQVDLSFEYYLPHAGLVSLAVFYKHVTNFIINAQTLDTRTATLADGGTRTLTFRRTQPDNLASVDLKGVEIGAQIPLSFLPSPFDGFGVFGNGTYVNAPTLPAEQNGIAFPLPGVSKFAYNIGGYFEEAGFGIRAYYNWRDAYDTGIDNYFGDREITTAYGQLDGSASYQINEHLTVTADIENATDAKTRQVNGFGLSRTLQQVGRRITAGVQVKF